MQNRSGNSAALADRRNNVSTAPLLAYTPEPRLGRVCKQRRRADVVPPVRKRRRVARSVLHVAAGPVPRVFSQVFQAVYGAFELSDVGGAQGTYQEQGRGGYAALQRSSRPTGDRFQLLPAGRRRRPGRCGGWHSIRTPFNGRSQTRGLDRRRGVARREAAKRRGT